MGMGDVCSDTSGQLERLREEFDSFPIDSDKSLQGRAWGQIVKETKEVLAEALQYINGYEPL